MSLPNILQFLSPGFHIRLALERIIYEGLSEEKISENSGISNENCCSYVELTKTGAFCTHPNNGNYHTACCNEFLIEGSCLNSRGRYTPR